MISRLLLFLTVILGCTPLAPKPQNARTSPRQSALSETGVTYRISREVLATMPSPHHDTYLALGVPYEPIRTLKNQIEAREGLSLSDRGEAHLTVVTPPEFSRLKAKLSMAEIEWLARTNGFYEAKFAIACVGRGKNKEKDQTYYLVVTSPELLNVRRVIGAEFVARGGEAKAFDPDHFFPHITIGFAGRDLHEDDGVIKDAKSCMGRVKLSEGLLTW